MGAIHQALIQGGAGAAVYLDQLSVLPFMVRGLRKKISTYAGPAIEVRRSSDNALQDIPFLSDGTIDLNGPSGLLTFVGANNGFVRRRYDQTGNGFHAVQTTNANQPSIVTAGVYNGRVSYNGSSQWMVTTAPTMGTQFAAVYAKLASTSSSTNIFFEQSTNYNSNAQSFVIYRDTPVGGPLAVAMRNTTAGSDVRLQFFPATINLGGPLAQVSVLLDRSTTGSAEEQAFQGTTQLTATVSGSPADQTGNFSTYDLYEMARAGSSLFNAGAIELDAWYRADTLAIRNSIIAITA